MKRPSWAENYVFYQLVDRATVPESQMQYIIEDSADFIEAHISKGVLVHCGVGVSRSAFVVLGYLMLKRQMSFDKAYEHTLARRPCICPNEGFCQYLRKLDSDLATQRREQIRTQLEQVEASLEDAKSLALSITVCV